jgi:hypothetical protein
MTDDTTTSLPNRRRRPDDRPSRRPSTKVKRAVQRQQVIQLLLGGASRQEIANALEMTPDRVSTITMQILEDWEAAEQGAVEKVRALQLARLDRLERAHWGAAIGQVVEDGTVRQVPPSLKATEAVLKIEALRARIAGTEAPRKMEVSGSVGFHLDVAEIERADRAWIESGGDVVIDATAREIP